jgi:protease secretion system membrane fusion protein
MAKIAFLKPAVPEPQEPQLHAAPLIEAAQAEDETSAYADSKRSSRIGLWALAIGFGGFLIWAAFAPLDEGIVAQGTVSVDTHRKPVQHLTGGIIKEVMVREGQMVKEGQVLMKLDEGAAKAAYEASRQKYFTLRAMESRLNAEQSNSRKMQFTPEVTEAAAKDPMVKSQLTTQEQLLSARRGNLEGDLASLRQQIQGQQDSIGSYKLILDSRKSQLALLVNELKNTRELADEGYAPRTKVWELERNVADANAAISDATGNIQRGIASVGDLRSRIISREQDYNKDVQQQMSDVKAQVEAEAEHLRSLTSDLDRIEIKSPATGQVVGLALQSAGGVVPPGAKIMDIVPTDEPLLLEAKVPPNYIDRMHKDLPVDIRFNTFANTPTLVVDGKAVSVSSDLITDPDTHQSYYLARVEVTPEGRKALGNRKLEAGMPTEMVFRTGERSLLTYLLGPLYKRAAASMKEA